MRRTAPEPIEAGGQDSFVDVVTNLVGILIVLVLLVGVRVKPAWKAANAAEAAGMTADVASAAKKDAAAELAHLSATAEGFATDIHKTAAQIAAVDRVMAARQADHEKLTTLVSAGEHALADRRAELGHDSREDYDLRRQFDELQAASRENEQELQRAENYRPPPVELKHYMTPLSRTVFGKEAHFRLCEGRVVYVPIEELCERAKTEIGQMTTVSEMTDRPHTVGPYGGFQMEYTLRLQSRGVQMKEYRIEPTEAQIGEPVGEALGPNSEFRRRLALLDPKETTVTIWVYADSFADYRRLNDELYRLGFAVAGRPLEKGRQIAGSADGTRSAAQ